MTRRFTGRLLALPEANVFLFGFLVNYVWEFLQTPLYGFMPEAPHWWAVQFCTVATIGDGALLVLGYWVTAAVAGSRLWVLEPRVRDLVVLLLFGELVTALFEWLGTGVWRLWAYASHMPVVPVVGTGIGPFLQWLLLPPLVVWIVRRQVHGELALARAAGATQVTGERRDL